MNNVGTLTDSTARFNGRQLTRFLDPSPVEKNDVTECNACRFGRSPLGYFRD